MKPYKLLVFGNSPAEFDCDSFEEAYAMTCHGDKFNIIEMSSGKIWNKKLEIISE